MTANIKLSILLAAFMTFICGHAIAAPKQAAKNPPAVQSREIKIAAVVNDKVITVSDVEARMKLYLMSSKAAPTGDDLKRLTHQTLDELIDESIQVSEAARYNINVPDEQVNAGLEQIAQRNNATAAKMTEDLKKSGIDVGTLKSKIKAEYAWAQLVKGKFSSKVNVSDVEINMTIDKLNSNDQPSYLLAQIDLLVQEKGKEQEVLGKAQDLVRLIREGARFSMVAAKNSQTPGASAGGDLGWLNERQIEPAVLNAVRLLKPGEITSPVRTEKGWSIVLLREVKQPDVKVQGEVKKEDENSRSQIASQLGTKRLAQMAQHFLKDLRAAAFIEKRI